MFDARFRRHLLDRHTFEMNSAGIGLDKAGQQIDERCLAGAIWPDQTDARAFHQINVDRLRHDQCAKTLVEVADRKCGLLAHVAPVGLRKRFASRRATRPRSIRPPSRNSTVAISMMPTTNSQA